MDRALDIVEASEALEEQAALEPEVEDGEPSILVAETQSVREPTPAPGESPKPTAEPDPMRGLRKVERNESASVFFQPRDDLALGPASHALAFVRVGDRLFFQSTEVSEALAAAALGFEPSKKAELPWGRVSPSKAAQLIDALNGRLPADAGFRFAVPTVEHRKTLSDLTKSRGEFQRISPSRAAEPKPGFAPETPRRSRTAILATGAARRGPFGLRGIVGNVRELVLDPSSEVPSIHYYGGAEHELKSRLLDADVRATKPADYVAKTSDGLRLVLLLDSP